MVKVSSMNPVTLFHAVISAALLSSRLLAQIEEGKVLKYFEFDEASGVKPDYPVLSLEDLRKITLYSKLVIQGAQVQVADDKYMRRIEPHAQDPGVLIVTSDRFRFAVLKNGVIDPKELAASDQKYFKFLWIKHATRESPDGKPWLKDLILLPYNKKTGKLLGPWPFSTVERPFDRFFLRHGDPRPARAKLPGEAKSVAGTFKSGTNDYLVLDVFGGYTWWGKVGALEYIALRKAGVDAVERFHKAQGKAGPPRWTVSSWRYPRARNPNAVLGTNQQSIQELLKRLPAVMDVPVRSEKPDGWEDLLLLEEENQPIKALDDELGASKTFGDLFVWAESYLDRRGGASSQREWSGPLEDRLAEKEGGYILALRVARYAFRRMGFPAQLLSAAKKENPLFPFLTLHVLVPSKDVSFVFFAGGGGETIFPVEAPALYGLPNNANTLAGKLPTFEVPLGGGKRAGLPVPRKVIFIEDR